MNAKKNPCNIFRFQSLYSQTHSLRSLEAEHLHNSIKEILEILPTEFDLNLINGKYPISDTQSLNLVLRQDIRRYNQLLTCIRNDTVQVLDAIQGKFFIHIIFQIVIFTSYTAAAAAYFA